MVGRVSLLLVIRWVCFMNEVCFNNNVLSRGN